MGVRDGDGEEAGVTPKPSDVTFLKSAAPRCCFCPGERGVPHPGAAEAKVQHLFHL